MSTRQVARQAAGSTNADALLIDRVEMCPECRWKFLNKGLFEVRRKRMAGSARASAMNILSCIHQGDYSGSRSLRNDVPLAGTGAPMEAC